MIYGTFNLRSRPLPLVFFAKYATVTRVNIFYPMKKINLLVVAPFLAITAMIASVQGASAMSNEMTFRSVASSVYGDAECGSILMTANSKYIDTSSVFYSNVLTKPNTTACLILSSYIRSMAMNLVAH